MSAHKMKDSGIEWIGEIPEDWVACRLKNIVNFNPRYSENLLEGTEVSFVPMEYLGNGKLEFQVKPVDDVAKGYNYFANGDIVMAKVTPCFENGNIAIAKDLLNGVGFGSSEIYTLRCFGCNAKFAFYFLQNITFKKKCVSSMYGVAGLKRIPIEFLQDYKLFMPPFSEQKAIAGYLDEKCAAIDQVVASKQKQNEQLAEYRQSLITEAVTKGLNPSVPMKDSGIEWIGKMPKEWEVCKLKNVVNFNPRYSENLLDGTEVSFVPMEYLGNGKLEFQAKPVDAVVKGYNYFANGDIVMAKVTPCFENGNIAIAKSLLNGVGFGSSEIYTLRCFGCNTKFAFYFLQNITFKKKCVSSMYGVGGLKRISIEFLQDYKLFVPPLAEQKAIAAYLDKKCGEIDALSGRNKNIIESLQEYKQSLIYEAVTGKIEL
ncbi:MAG: restriction endonuclease subunit S [Acidaminococcaceae bacterium]